MKSITHKIIIINLIFVLCGIIIFSSCGTSFEISKRRYNKGFFVDVSSKKSSSNLFGLNNKTEVKKIQLIKTVVIPIPESSEKKGIKTLLASTSKKIISSKYNQLKHFSTKVQDIVDECDIIIFSNGDEVKGKVQEITETEIKYKRCDNLTGPTYTANKSKVFMIRYANGTKDVITPANTTSVPSQDFHTPPTSTNKDQGANKKEETGSSGVASIVFAIVGLLMGGLAIGIAFEVIAIILGAVGLGKNRKLKGLAIAGFIIGLLSIVSFAAAVAIFL